MSLKDDLNNLPQKTLTEIQRQAESYLAAQLQSGIAADARAIYFVTLMAAATVALGGGGAALILATPPLNRLGTTTLLMAGGFLISMACAVVSARPVDFEYVGGLPEDWVDDARDKVPLKRSTTELLQNYNKRIKANNVVLATNARWMTAALWSALISVALGTMTAVCLLQAGQS